MGFLLLGIDSLIACIAVGPMMSRRMQVLVPFAVLFGIGDGGGFLLGTAFHWSAPDNLSQDIWVTTFVLLGVYWIAIALFSRKMASAELESKSRWGVWVLPWVLSIDNITFGAVDGVPAHFSVWASAGEQALSSSVQAGIGLAIGIGLAATFPVLRRRMPLAMGLSGVAMLAAIPVLMALG